MKTIKTAFIFCFLTVSFVSKAQQVVSGRITDAANGKPLPYTTVYIANTTIGAFSDDSGSYTITIPGQGSYEIMIVYVGYHPVFHKIDEPKPFHHIDFALKTNEIEMKEVIITSASSKHTQRDIDLFWRVLLGQKPSEKGLEVLNPEKVYFYLNSDSVLTITCKEPIGILNHEMGYNIRYVLKIFKYDYRIDDIIFNGQPNFEELIPKNNFQKNRWEKKRRDVYAVSITHFIRALYRDKTHEEGFLLVKWGSNRDTDSSSVDILHIDQNRVLLNIDSTLYLACFSKPVTDKMIKNVDKTMFGYYENFPVMMIYPQQLFIYPDGTYSGMLTIREVRNRVSGLSAMLPIEYGYIEQK